MNFYQNKPIHSWMAEDRPREKMLDKGMSSLTEAELIATLLNSGTRELSAIDLGRLLIAEFGGLRQLAQASLADLMKVKGIGKAKAVTIASCFELARRKGRESKSKRRMLTAKQIAGHFRSRMDDLAHEELWVLYLNSNNNILAEERLFVGGLDSVNVDPRKAYRQALNIGATCMVIVHNHPSGSTRPSQADRDVTRIFVGIGRLMNIKLLDHVIVCGKDYFSFSESGQMEGMSAQVLASMLV